MLQLIQQKSTVLRFQGFANTLSHANPKYSYWIHDSQARFCKFIILDLHFCDPGIAEVALLAYALSLIYQDRFAEIRLKTLGLINANPFS